MQPLVLNTKHLLGFRLVSSENRLSLIGAKVGDKPQPFLTGAVVLGGKVGGKPTPDR